MKEYYEKGRCIWVAPGAVRYNREHIELLLPWLEDMREGAYPHEPKESGYRDGSKPGVSHHAPYETVCQVAAEIDTRLARTGTDRYLVEDYYVGQMTLQDISRKTGLDEHEVNRRIRSAVSYISSGRCQRWVDCGGCSLREGCSEERKGKRKPVSYRDWIAHRQKQWEPRKRKSTAK